jgi:hypothetical protein
LCSVAGDSILSTGGVELGVFSFNTDIVTTPVQKEELELGQARPFKKAFISYAHEDENAAKAVVTLLRSFGYESFYDRDSLACGDFFEPKIMRGIEDSDVFVLLWSHHAAQSPFVKKEYLHALPLAFPEGCGRASLVIRPFFVKQPHAEPPFELRQINFVDLYSRQ